VLAARNFAKALGVSMVVMPPSTAAARLQDFLHLDFARPQ